MTRAAIDDDATAPMAMEVINIDSSDDEAASPGIPPAVSSSPSEAAHKNIAAAKNPPPAEDDSSASSADSIWEKPGLPPKKQKNAANASAPKRKKSDVPIDEDTDDDDEDLEVVEKSGGASATNKTRSTAQPAGMDWSALKQPPAPTVDAYLGKWKVMLLMDVREFGQHKGSDFLQKTEAKINKHFGGVHCELLSLPSADYMFVARLISHDTGEVIDERVLDLIIERKHINDLQTCLIIDSKKHRPLKFFEAQMYKMQHCGVRRKLFLMEGDEDDPKQFSLISAKGYRGTNVANKMEQMKRLKRVKTVRLQIAVGEWQGVDVVSTRHREDTVQFLIFQLEELKRTFDPSRPPAMTMEDVKSKINEEMKAPTLREYLRLISQPGIGPVKAMKVIMDPKLDWDKTFISPSCLSRKTKSTLEDHATFWGESKADVGARNLANARSRAMRSKQSSGLIADIDDLDKNVGAACPLCRGAIDIFADEGIVNCNRVAKCGKSFHQACLSAQGYDISASDGCPVCRSSSKFSGNGQAFSGKGQALGKGKKPSAAAKANSNPENAARDARLKRFDRAATEGSTTSEASSKKKSRPKGKKASGSEKEKGTSAGKKRKWQKPAEKVYMQPAKDRKPAAAAKATTIIDRNGCSANPLHDADKYAHLLDKLDKADSGSSSGEGGSAKKKRASNSGSSLSSLNNHQTSSTSNTEEEDVTACGVCKEAINIFVEQDIVACNRVTSCGAAFHEGCLAACEYDLQAHDGCISCEDKSKFVARCGEEGNQKPAAKADTDDVIVVDSDDEDNRKAAPHQDDDVIVID
ncbi:hypothetical protein ACHAXT_006094 [Thalassiosira profunda]